MVNAITVDLICLGVLGLLLGTLVQAFRAYRATVIARYQSLAAERAGDSICTFARSLDYRRLDTEVIRAVYDWFQIWVGKRCPAFPVRASDNIVTVYDCGDVDLLDIIDDIASRTGHTLDHFDQNPHWGQVCTVADLIAFVSAQPREL